MEVHAEVIGLHSLESTSAECRHDSFTNSRHFASHNIKIDHCRGQCYDGASNMSGVRSGVATKLLGLESRAFYTNCYGHALNLATQDALKGEKTMRDVLDTVFEITKLIKNDLNVI